MTNSVNSRELIVDLLTEILEKGAYSHLVLRQAMDKYPFLEKQERAWIKRTVDGTLEHLLSIDFVLDRYSKTKTEKMKPFIRTLLRMSVYQLLYMERVPDAAVCNEAVKLAGKRKFTGLKGFVNGILRSVSREKAQLLDELNPENLQKMDLPDRKDPSVFSAFLAEVSRISSLPEWLLLLWLEELGWEEMKKTILAFGRENKLSVRCNLSRAPMDQITESLHRQKVSWEVSPYAPNVLLLSHYDHLEALEAFSRGWLQVQDVSSVLAGEAVSPKEGDFILDVCAAPGGKSLHMADRLLGSGMVEARDLTWQKIERIEENIRRCGFKNIRTVCQDARMVTPESVEKADIVLADLPCSGLGIIGKKPDIRWRIHREDLEKLAALQREILAVVWQYVKPGGLLVYSTCTIHRQENQENVQWFLANYPFTAVDICGRFGPELSEASMREGFMQFLPGKHGCDGFFVAVLRRKENEAVITA